MMKKILSLVNIACLMLLGITIYLDNNPTFAQGKFGEGMTESLAPDMGEAYTHFAALQEDTRSAAALDELGFNVSLTGELMGRDFSASRSLTHCKAIIYRALKTLPEEHSKPLRYLTLRMSDMGHRGLGNGNSMILRCESFSDSEMAAVLVHEVGHIVDLGLVAGDFFSGGSEFLDGSVPVYNDDLSLEFYRISWENSETMREDASAADFVTGYAMTDPFEDFAESYIMYALHGSRFRMMARQNEVLREKYDYLRNNIFDNKEFTSLTGNIWSADREYDATLIPYDMERFLSR